MPDDKDGGDQPDLMECVPAASEIRKEIGRLLRRLGVARQMLRIVEKADRYKKLEGEDKN